MNNYKNLVINWHNERSEDYFSRFVFQYLAFICYLLKYKYIDVSRDRDVIQRLKDDEDVKQCYFKKNKIPKELIDQLKLRPLENVNRPGEIQKYWNNDTIRPLQKNTDMGFLNSETDWANLIELWYTVRNNLFHGAKDPQSARDKLMVEYAYETIKPLVEIFVKELNKNGKYT